MRTRTMSRCRSERVVAAGLGERAVCDDDLGASGKPTSDESSMGDTGAAPELGEVGATILSKRDVVEIGAGDGPSLRGAPPRQKVGHG